MFTYFGVFPFPCPPVLFRLVALVFSCLVICAAFAVGTHFGYFLFGWSASGLPHSGCLPFILVPMSTHFSLNHLSRSSFQLFFLVPLLSGWVPLQTCTAYPLA